ncbi:peptidase C39 family protein [Microbacteriaceae bacterium VKM Ac-2855]|nr:peptidase C39 family protein [Microbacteriaceae bacterium VKM Ac-2855]
MPDSSAGVEAIRVIPFDRTTIPASVARLASAAVIDRWSGVDRSSQQPRLIIVDGSAAPVAAALITARPQTAAVKIVDAIGDLVAAAAAAVSYAQDLGLVQVKWEGWSVDAATAATVGFTPLAAPLSPVDPDGPAAGYVRWLVGEPPTEPPYYRQSESFTCGAVTALTALVQVGDLPAESLDRAAELRLWRDATNFAACEPVGLGVAIRRARPTSPVTVSLDTDEPVLVHFYGETEQEWRAVLQRASREDAAMLGVPIDRRRLSTADIRAALARGEQVLLLVSLTAMLGYDVPHWVLCHGAVRGALVVEDPWVDAPRGESWVDAHLLPVADAALDAMSLLEDGRFRGAVRVGAGVG